MSDFNAYREGAVHVLAEKCKTCVFRPGNPMRLPAGRLRGMVDSALAEESAIICHSTLPYAQGQPTEQAVCRGFWDRHRGDSLALRAADVFGCVRFDQPPPTHETGPEPDPTKDTA